MKYFLPLSTKEITLNVSNIVCRGGNVSQPVLSRGILSFHCWLAYKQIHQIGDKFILRTAQNLWNLSRSDTLKQKQ